MARLRHCAIAPDMDEAVMWLAVVATATVGGNAVEDQQRRQQKAAADAEQAGEKADAAPMPRMTSQWTDISAMGR